MSRRITMLSRWSGAIVALAIALPHGYLTATAHAYSVVSATRDVEVDCGSSGTDVPTDWYFPQPNDNLGLIWVQHGFSRANNQYVDLATELASHGYVVFATSLAPGSAGCAMNNAGFLSDFSRLFPDLDDPDTGLLSSAKAAAQSAGISLNTLPASFAFTGHSAGAGSIAHVARKLIENHPATATDLVGLVLLDPVEGIGTSLVAEATTVVAAAGLPALTISSPPYTCNSSANGTNAFLAGIGRPFAGVRLTSGSHCDAEGDSTDFLCTAFCGSPQAENVSILQTLTKGWFDDFFAGTPNPTFYPGGSYYQSKIASGRMVTLPQSSCGNGALDAGEQCDDGNRFDGDCCSGFCAFEATGSACEGDANPCTDDVCNGSGTCTHPANTAPCDDGAFCTVGDTCSAGICTGSARDCSSASGPCADGACDEVADSCIAAPKPDGTACDDLDACTSIDFCVDGSCAGGDPVQCTPLSQCHAPGTCNPATGACSNPILPDGSACDDANACTQSDSCQNGACQGSAPVVCGALDQCHAPGTCDPDSGACSNPAKPNGSACSDGDACTQSDTCQNGACEGATPVVCTPLDQCHEAGSCDPSSGSCSNPPKADGSSCDDGDACSQTDTCAAGTCTGSDPVVCAPLSQCHDAGTCNPATGTCSDPTKPDGSGCDDGDACTQADSCLAGACTGGDLLTCDSPDPCVGNGTCDPATGECSQPAAPAGTPCDDASICTVNDVCDGNGSCLAGNAASGCASAATNILTWRDSGGGSRDKLIWRWAKGATTSQSDFGDPTSISDYTLCFYTGPQQSLLTQLEIGPDAARWSALSDRGYRYKDRDYEADGVGVVLLRANDRDRTKISITGKGSALPDISDGTAMIPEAPLTVQLLESRAGTRGMCWESTFPAQAIRRNDPNLLKAVER